MKYNKGFAPVLILIVVLGVLAVGGGAYFVGKSSAPKNEVSDNSNYFPQADQNYTPPTTSNTNNNVTPPINTQTNNSVLPLSIISISPNPASSNQTVTIKGTGFSTTNTVVFSSSALLVGLPSVDGKTITFKPSDYPSLKSGLVYVVDSSAIASGQIVKGTLFLPETATIQMAGKSNAVQFTITAQANTSNLKTYTNTKYGFSIQHPTGTQISDVDISGGRSIFFTTSQGTVIVQVVTQAWNNGVLSSPPNCSDTASGADRTNTNINGINFLTFSMSKEMSGMNSPASATEYCAIRNGIAYKLITKVGYAPGSSNGLNLDKNPTLNQMVTSFKLN
ncbi:MAG: IPT/TIG domain-containing protein [Candidatus Paceibacterota bacterium]|jgi:hypothetical protein